MEALQKEGHAVCKSTAGCVDCLPQAKGFIQDRQNTIYQIFTLSKTVIVFCLGLSEFALHRLCILVWQGRCGCACVCVCARKESRVE